MYNQHAQSTCTINMHTWDEAWHMTSANGYSEVKGQNTRTVAVIKRTVRDVT